MEGESRDDLEGTPVPCLFPSSLAVEALRKNYRKGHVVASCLEGCAKSSSHFYSWSATVQKPCLLEQEEVAEGEGAAGGLSLVSRDNMGLAGVLFSRANNGRRLSLPLSPFFSHPPKAPLLPFIQNFIRSLTPETWPHPITCWSHCTRCLSSMIFLV